MTTATNELELFEVAFNPKTGEAFTAMGYSLEDAKARLFGLISEDAQYNPEQQLELALPVGFEDVPF